jgi:hypothetical protein
MLGQVPTTKEFGPWTPEQYRMLQATGQLPSYASDPYGELDAQKAIRAALDRQKKGGTDWEKFSKEWRNWALVGSGVIALYLLWRLNK